MPLKLNPVNCYACSVLVDSSFDCIIFYVGGHVLIDVGAVSLNVLSFMYYLRNVDI